MDCGMLAVSLLPIFMLSLAKLIYYRIDYI